MKVWNDVYGRFHAGEKDIPDMAFINAMNDDIIARFAADRRRIYATGFSNGGEGIRQVPGDRCHLGVLSTAFARDDNDCAYDLKTEELSVPDLALTDALPQIGKIPEILL